MSARIHSYAFEQAGTVPSTKQLIEQVDILATAEDRDRTDVLIDALRTYLSDASESDEMKRDLANAYHSSINHFDECFLLLL